MLYLPIKLAVDWQTIGKVFIREQGEFWIGTATEGREGIEDEESCYYENLVVAKKGL